MAQQPPDASLLNRLFVRRLSHEQRGLIGPVMFFLLILLVGWAALNEPVRMRVFSAQYEGRSIQRGASIFDSNCSTCHGRDGKGLEGVAPSLNAPDMFDGTRLEQMGWTGSLYDYVYLTIAAGRPVMSQSWPQPMPTWSQEYGGPMRTDEVRDVVAFVLNYGKFYEEGYEGPVAPPTAEPTEEPEFTAVGTDLEGELPEGDVARGQALFSGAEPAPDGAILACNACHSVDGSPLVGPSMEGLGGRVPSEYDSVEAYVREAIVLPEAFKQSGFENVNMPANFGERLDAQSLADLLAYLTGEFGQ